MAKQLKIHKNHEEAAKHLLEEGFRRSPEERIVWLLRQIKQMQKLNPTAKPPRGYVLKKKNGWFLPVFH